MFNVSFLLCSCYQGWSSHFPNSLIVPTFTALTAGISFWNFAKDQILSFFFLFQLETEAAVVFLCFFSYVESFWGGLHPLPGGASRCSAPGCGSRCFLLIWNVLYVSHCTSLGVFPLWPWKEKVGKHEVAVGSLRSVSSASACLIAGVMKATFRGWWL